MDCGTKDGKCKKCFDTHKLWHGNCEEIPPPTATVYGRLTFTLLSVFFGVIVIASLVVLGIYLRRNFSKSKLESYIPTYPDNYFSTMYGGDDDDDDENEHDGDNNNNNA